MEIIIILILVITVMYMIVDVLMSHAIKKINDAWKEKNPKLEQIWQETLAKRNI
jgi:predicted Holliday junction resolvase-like endonuclease